ncbi:MAG: ATP-grasp domain-containing protein, partial [Pseudonocardiaceae bacterium]
AQAERLLDRFQWHGPVMVELRDDGEDGPWLMEVNGRFWVSLQLAVTAGVDFPRLWVDLLLGESVEGPTPYQEGVALRWLWGDVKRFAGIVLSGPPPGYPSPYPTVGQGIRELLGPQPPNTTLEMWQPDDRLPAVGEVIQALRQTAGFLRRREMGWR